MLLLPERCPRKVVEHRVREALRYGERDDDEVSVEGGREGGEQRHGAIAKRLPHRRPDARETLARASEPQPHCQREPERDRHREQEPRPRERVEVESASETTMTCALATR